MAIPPCRAIRPGCYLKSVDLKGSPGDARSRVAKERDPYREFGRRVRALRERARVSQERLAESAGVHRTYVGSVERGERNISLHNILRLADALGVDPADLVGGLKQVS